MEEILLSYYERISQEDRKRFFPVDNGKASHGKKSEELTAPNLLQI